MLRDRVYQSTNADIDGTDEVDGMPAEAAHLLSPFGDPSFAASAGLGSHRGLGFTVPVLGVDTDDVIDLLNVGKLLGGGGSTPDPMKPIWQKIPWESIPANVAVRGSDGKAHDPSTGAVLSDAQFDARKGALVAPYVGAYADANNHWFDDITGQHLTSEQAYQRWTQAYGAGATFASVVGRGMPFGEVSSVVPVPIAPAGAGIPYQPPVAPSPSVPSTMPVMYPASGSRQLNPDGTPTYNGAPYSPLDTSNPYNIRTMRVPVTPAPSSGSGFGMSTTTMALLAAAVVGGVLLMNQSNKGGGNNRGRRA